MFGHDAVCLERSHSETAVSHSFAGGQLFCVVIIERCSEMSGSEEKKDKWRIILAMLEDDDPDDGGALNFRRLPDADYPMMFPYQADAVVLDGIDDLKSDDGYQCNI